jgi:branched-chain amino acid transport system substrate-binding protein
MILKYSLSISLSLLVLTSCATQPHYKKETVKRTQSSLPLVSKEKQENLSLGAIPNSVPAVKVALLVPLSGESAPVGNAMFDAATLALYDSYVATPSDQINAQLIIMPKDTGNTSNKTIEATKQSIEQGATFVIGPLFSQSVDAIKPILKEKNITMLSFSNTKSVAEPDAYIFGFLPEQQVERIAEYAYLNKFQRVAVLAPNDAYGEKVVDKLSEVYLKKGGQVAPAELYAPSQANIDAAVSRIAASYNNTPEDRRFQAIFIADSGPQMRNIIKSIHKNHINLQKIKLLGTSSWDDEELAKIPEIQGAWFPSSPPKMYSIFEKRFMTTYGYKPIRLAGLAYDAVTIAAKIAMDGNGINSAALTNPKGFNTPAGGLVRLLKEGTSDRKLVIMEVDPQGFKVIDKAPNNFSD